MSLIAKFIVALFVVFLHYVTYIGIRGLRAHRYHLCWTKLDAVAIVLGMLVLTTGLFGIDLLVSWSSSVFLRRIFNHLFLLALLSGWLASFSLSRLGVRPNVVQLIWLIGVAVIGYSCALPETPLVRYAAYSCLILSPAIVLATIPLFSWETLGSKPESRPSAPQEVAKGAPVFFIVFDEWSFPRSSAGGEFLPHLKNLRELCRQSVFFPHALSPYGGTLWSLPAILFQTDKEYTIGHSQPLFQGREGAVPLHTMGNLFGLSRKYNYGSYLLGWFHPYRQLLGDQVDYCHVISEKPLSTGLIGKTVCSILGLGAFLTDPLSRTLWPRFDAAFASWQWFVMGNLFRKEMLQVLAESPPRSFAFFHAPWPHAPFVFATDGSYTGALLDNTSTNDYLRQIAYVDHMVGEIVGTLQAAGKFDDALLIITSDHGWRYDPDQAFRSLPKFDRSVPLLIKLPGQHSGRVLGQEFCNNQLTPLLEAVFAGKKDSEELVQLLTQLAAGSMSRACAG